MPWVRSPSRSLALLLLVSVAAGACTDAAGGDGSGGGEANRSTSRSPVGTSGDQASTAVASCTPLDELEGGDVSRPPPTDAPFPWDREAPKVRDGFDETQIISGGPPPDGIAPIDEPCFDDVATADQWLEPQSPVMTVEVDGDRRAYPLAILTQHEIVNDVIGGEPVVVTYCPLCNSGLAFFRHVDGTVLDFGTSGRLYRANLVMYDRQTRTLLSQFVGEAVVGEMVPADLERLSTALLDWDEFRHSTPDGLVLSRDSFPGRDYGRNPYPGYEETGDSFLFEGPRDERLPPTTRVVGLGSERDPVAIPLPDLQEARVARVEVDGRPVTVWWAPGQASALDTPTIDEGSDVGSTGAFIPSLEDGTELTFAADPDDENGFRDTQTGSRWNLLGEAVDGELAGATLEAVPRDDTFWFVWFAFHPDTRIER